MHCKDPILAQVCPADATRQTEGASKLTEAAASLELVNLPTDHDLHSRINAPEVAFVERGRCSRGADSARHGRVLHFERGSQPGSADELDAAQDVVAGEMFR